jgi:hypothetical protein
VAQATLERPTAAWLRGARPGPARSLPEDAARAPRLLFWVLVVFILLEYIRPPVLSQLKFQMLAIVVIPVLWLASPARPWARVLTLQAALLAWIAKSLPLAYNYFNVYVTARVMYGNLAVGVALIWVGANLRDLRRLLFLWVGAMTYQAVWALGHGGRGTGGMLGDENDLALACTTALPLALSGAERLHGRARWLLLAASALMVAAVVASFSRGGFVGLVLAVGYLVFASRNRLRVLAVIAAGALLFVAFAPQAYLDELKTIQDTDDGTAKGRKFLWTAAYNMWLDHPILGVGALNATFHIGRYQPTDFEGREYNERDWSGVALHSAWFTLLSEQGAVGVLIFAALFWQQFATVRRLRRDVRARGDVPDELRRQVECFGVGLNGAVVAYAGCGTFLSVLYYPYFWYFTVFTAALDLAVRRELARLPAPAAPPPGGA